MKLIDMDTIQLSNAELTDIYFFIRESLAYKWHSSVIGNSNITEEAGMRSMDSYMYDMAEQIRSLI